MEEKKEEGFNKEGIITLLLVIVFLALLYFTEEWRKNKENSDLIAACQPDIRNAAKYPAKAIFTSAVVATSGTNSKQVSGKVEFMNGFGAMLPHVYKCEMTTNGTVKSTYTNPEG